MRTPGEWTTIALKKATRDRLCTFAMKKQSYDTLLNWFMDVIEKENIRMVKGT